MIAKDSAKHDEHGASFSDLCKIMSPSKKKNESKIENARNTWDHDPFWGAHTEKTRKKCLESCC